MYCPNGAWRDDGEDQFASMHANTNVQFSDSQFMSPPSFSQHDAYYHTPPVVNDAGGGGVFFPSAASAAFPLSEQVGVESAMPNISISTAKQAGHAAQSPKSPTISAISASHYNGPPSANTPLSIHNCPRAAPSSPNYSPFYKILLSPFCDFLIDFVVPRRVPPDWLTTGGFIAALFGAIAAVCDMHLTAVFLWILYGLLDNLDGKQARRLGVCGASGDFFDHSVDSNAATLGIIVWLQALIPDRMLAWHPIIAASSQLAFYVGCWGHLVTGNVVLGLNTTGRDWFTVDEYNLLFIPTLCLLRRFTRFWDRTMFSSTLFASIFSSEDGNFTWGMLIAIATVVVTFPGSILFVRQCFSKEYLSLLLPGIVYVLLTCIFRPPMLFLIPLFALTCIELIHLRFLPKKGAAQRLRLWWPLLLYVVVGYWILPSATGTTTQALTAFTLASLNIVLLFFYKRQVASLPSKIVEDDDDEKAKDKKDGWLLC